MKRFLLLLGFLTIFSSISQAKPEVSVADNTLNYNIPDGWYEATVKYFNPSTYTKSTYTLNVKVQYGRVTVIDFGNGGSVHSGYNNSGYVYSGGSLYIQRDYSTGEILSATTKVTITEGNTMTTFDIIL